MIALLSGGGWVGLSTAGATACIAQGRALRHAEGLRSFGADVQGIRYVQH